MLKTKEQNKYMLEALQIAKQSANEGEIPVGAIIIDRVTKKIIATSGNLTEQQKDPTAHAEINAIKKACQHKNSRNLSGCDIYVTLEPCPMCAQAISFARIDRIFFAAYDVKGGGVDNGAKIFNSSSCHHQCEIYGGIEEEKSKKLLQDFFLNKR